MAQRTLSPALFLLLVPSLSRADCPALGCSGGGSNVLADFRPPSRATPRVVWSVKSNGTSNDVKRLLC